MARTPFDPHNYHFSERAHRLAQRTIYPPLIEALARREGFRVQGEPAWEDMGFSRADADDGVDRVLYLSTDQGLKRFTVQERFRRQQYAHFRQLTVTAANRRSGAQGDFFKLKADLYAYGYVEGDFDGWVEAVVADVPTLHRRYATGCLFPRQSVYARKGQIIWGFPFDKLDQAGALILHHRRSGQTVTF